MLPCPGTGGPGQLRPSRGSPLHAGLERMDKTVHQAKARDGTRLHWSEVGAGSPAVILTDGIGCAGFVWRHLEPALARRHRVIHWNYRGHGRSATPRDPYRVTLDDCVEDLLTVMDAAAEQRAILVGHSMGVQVSLEVHRRMPARVLALVLVCGAPGHPLDTFHDSTALKLVFPFARNAVERHPILARVVFKAVVPTDFAAEVALAHEVNRARVDRADLVRYFADLSEIDPLLFVRMLASASETDSTDHLRHVAVPTLVVAGEKDTFTPVHLSRSMHRAIPGAELGIVAGGTHVTPLEYPAVVARHVRGFLGRALERPAAPGRTRAGRTRTARPRRSGSRKALP